jgi:hypothetical protein
MDTRALAHANILEALERLIAGLPSQAAPVLIGELARLQALLWVRVVTPSQRDEDRADTRSAEEANQPGPLWMSTDAVTQHFGLSRRWLEDHGQELRRRHIISKPSRKTTLFHARRLARFLEHRSRT